MSGYKSRTHQFRAFVRASKTNGKPIGIKELIDSCAIGAFDERAAIMEFLKDNGVNSNVLIRLRNARSAAAEKGE